MKFASYGCNQNVTQLAKQCNMMSVSLHRESETKTLIIYET